MTKPPETVSVEMAGDGVWLRLPESIRNKLFQFLIDNSSGNVQFNVDKGQIRKLVIEEHIR